MTKNIKNLKPSGPYKHGDFAKYKPLKYFGPVPIYYRSSLELNFMRKCEANHNVEKWSSEHIKIPYFLKEKKGRNFVNVRHVYNTDFTVILKNGTKFVIEIKPESLCPRKPEQMRRNPAMQKNAAKWLYAIRWCKANGYVFRVITEIDLKNKIF